MSMNRRGFLARSGLVAGGVISGAGAFAGAQKKAQPNMLVVLADDCTFRDLPLYGGQNAKTPHIDNLASEGMVFNRCLLYTSDAADDLLCVDLGGRRIIKKTKK